MSIIPPISLPTAGHLPSSVRMARSIRILPTCRGRRSGGLRAAAHPVGALVAFWSGGFEYDLVEAALDGAIAPLLVTSRQEYSASWSPSGRQYAYVGNARGIPAIWLRHVAANSARLVVQNREEGA